MYDISVVICTYNRAEILKETLKSWLSVDGLASNVELIIVDNNSTDHTKHVVESFRPACPTQLRYVREANAGLSYARNRGIDEASGNIVAFVDDDVYFDKCWVNAVLEVFNDHSEISCLGGKSIPKFDGDKPDWITENLLGLYGCTRSGDLDKLMIFPEYPFGLNMAFRKSVFSQVGKFNPRLGRVKKSLLSGEEKDMFYRISKAGLKVFYSPKAVIYHRIPIDRMNKRWILKRIYWQAASDVIFNQSIQKKSRFILLKTAIGSIKRIILPTPEPTPKNIYLYYRSFSFNKKLIIYRLLGIFKQNLAEIFTISK